MTELLDTFISGFGLVEGPRYDDENCLYFCDSLNGGVFRCNSLGIVETVIPKRKGVGGIALHADGGIIVSGRDICHVKRGVSRTLLKLDGAARFNDIATPRVFMRGRPVSAIVCQNFRLYTIFAEWKEYFQSLLPYLLHKQFRRRQPIPLNVQLPPSPEAGNQGL